MPSVVKQNRIFEKGSKVLRFSHEYAHKCIKQYTHSFRDRIYIYIYIYIIVERERERKRERDSTLIPGVSVYMYKTFSPYQTHTHTTQTHTHRECMLCMFVLVCLFVPQSDG